MTAGRQERGEITPNARRLSEVIAATVDAEYRRDSSITVAEVLQAIENVRFHITEAAVRDLPRT